jgi:2-hydroxychromene-2-carboxylate isomerase
MCCFVPEQNPVPIPSGQCARASHRARPVVAAAARPACYRRAVRPVLEFWYDFSCPYAYLASTRIERLAAEAGAELVPSPMLLGGVFRARDVAQNLMSVLSEAKARHNFQDMMRWSRRLEAPLTIPAGHPIRTVDALRAVLAVGEPFLPLSHAMFRAYWVDGVDLSTEAGLRSVLEAEGHDAEAVLARARSPEIKDALRRRTDEAIAKGVFGAPAMILDGRLFWGQDRLDAVASALGQPPPPLRFDAPPRHGVDFWFDYSSPYSFVAETTVGPALGAAVRYRPMFLGGVWRANNPASLEGTVSAAKTAYLGADFRRQAERAGLRHRWPSRFPMKTVLPLRATLAAGPDTPAGRALVRALFAAYWTDDRDISRPEVVGELADRVGLDGAALLAAAEAEPARNALREATEAAIDAGVFGAPSFVVDGEPPALFWGADRLELAVRVAHGEDALR